METEAYKVDRSKWPSGPWDNEPEDKVEFEHNGMACMLVRNRSGNWCGYVGLEPSHKYFEKSYDEIDVEVHGGLTYSNKCGGAICHVAKPGKEENIWWVGFDTAHCDDRSPGYDYLFTPILNRTLVYRTKEYVINETCKLADQLCETQTP